MKRERIIIMGAAGRDFHNFNMAYRDNPHFEVRAFTAAQIPFIEERVYPPELAGPLYPEGIPIYPEEKLAALITGDEIDQVVFAYSDVSHTYVMHKASLCLSLGADFTLLGPAKTMLKAAKPVISVCAVRTGCGKSGISRYIIKVLKSKGMEPVAIRHPMPYCEIGKSRVERFSRMEDLDRLSCTIEEREEFEPLINSGTVVYAGVDYGEILRQAEQEANIIVWDGGNNDMPFIRPDIEAVVLDPHRAGHELLYHPGETNLRRAHIAIINKVNTATKEKIKRVEENIRWLNPEAEIVHTASRITIDPPSGVKGKKVLVVEDGPTLTHGGMSYGAGLLAAQTFGAAEIVDPRPYAKGSIREIFEKYGHIKNLLPAMGYAQEQMKELKDTIESVPCDIVLIATPVDLGALLQLNKHAVRVRYEIEETEGMALKGYIEGFVDSTHHGV